MKFIIINIKTGGFSLFLMIFVFCFFFFFKKRDSLDARLNSDYEAWSYKKKKLKKVKEYRKSVCKEPTVKRLLLLLDLKPLRS